ncbi:NADH:ubiquinone oxidoreductase subunit 5 (subunit L)/multisubunit Na+/H+ antiporter MnhA subunit [Agrobacterium larrymoorei]|uniref:NADH:ubiquinone oxidoreductase subunit 5 (Subunit L)/multisubunit Na+/H+ antiporter MnhA subunit n=1 Tax=Agrobacterium larrymoorei TaxID=160699 RepID=A0AAJ2BCC6_9HYPH|nr:NADH:ubiquinone oxidoreductase subunit 5 (subunit L)/multisubunit Na+/H+ antiporter MnhA subunit [Agrobacterium larrymoorei]
MRLDVILPILIALPFIGSIATAMMPRSGAARGPAAVAGGIALFGLISTIFLYTSVTNGRVLKYDVEWLPQLGLNFTLRLDGFAWMFMGLITGIGFLVVLYARYYMSAEDPIPRFFAFLLAFMGSMLGIVLSGNVIILSIFWEMTSIFSFLLIGYWHNNATARDGARMALTVTGIGGFCLLAGLLVLGHIAGSYDLDAIIAKAADVKAHPLYLTALVLILIGALTKSAQFPFHFWLPNAMAAPTPVSAYLHSATMVKAGVFLLARLWPVLAGTQEWFWLVGFAGITTLLLGAYFAMFQQDLKGLLAYSTISHLGLITTLLSLGSPLAAVAAIFHMANHATFKASLFMAAGIIDHETGTRDMRRLSGLYRYLPATATLAMAASAAMAGVPLFNGFLSKEMFFAEAIETHADSLLDKALPYVATLSGAFAVAYSLRFIHTVFFGPPPSDIPNPNPHEPPRWMRFPVEFLVLACLIVGVVPSLSVGPFLHTAVLSVLGPQTPTYSLAIWHGFNLPLIMSIVALIGGVAIYALLGDYFAKCDDGPPNLPALERPAHLRAHHRHRFVEVGALAGKHARHKAVAATVAYPRIRRARCRFLTTGVIAVFAYPSEGYVLRPDLCGSLGHRHDCGHGCCLAGEVSSPCRACDARCFRSRHLPDLCLVVRSRSCHHATARRNRHAGADPARSSLAAEASREGR